METTAPQHAWSLRNKHNPPQESRPVELLPVQVQQKQRYFIPITSFPIKYLHIIKDIGFIDDLERYCPPLMEEPDIEENIKSDECRIKRFMLNVSDSGEEVKLNQQ